MFQVPDWYLTMSMGLSDVLDEITVNEKMLTKHRRMVLLQETILTLTDKESGIPYSNYFLGSLSEATTTPGLESDQDQLGCDNSDIIIHNWSEWTRGLNNLLMIKDKTTPPGYCLLQQLRSDEPLPETEEYENYRVRDKHGRILFKNTYLDIVFSTNRQGPAETKQGLPGRSDTDAIIALPCKSWPEEAKKWFHQQGSERWLTNDKKMYIQNTKCFVVGAGNKVSENEEFEWRISTSLAERCLMFNLNITQIRCYILMKMILKTHINPYHKGRLSSYMCKTVLLHSIKSKDSNIWQEGNLLTCLSYCLLTLHGCIERLNCPHFFIKKNNLMAGKFSYEERNPLLELFLNLRQNIGTTILRIPTDDLGLRLQIKLNMVPQLQYNFTCSAENMLLHSLHLSRELAETIATGYRNILCRTTQESVIMCMQQFLNIMLDLISYYREGNMWVKTSCKLLTPFVSSTLGSLIASYNISHNSIVSPQAFGLLSAGLLSDIASSRLKLASVCYSVGDMESVALILRDTEELYYPVFVEAVCECYFSEFTGLKRTFDLFSSQNNEEVIRHSTAFCVRFLRFEINCVPHELRYEMFRSTEEELLHRGGRDRWMDWAVLDSLPYLYFLQYKTFGHLHRNENKKQALDNLAWATETESNLGHRETALNLLGQCLEQENRPVDAFRCYMLSLNFRARNNAARIHTSVLLSKLINNT